MKKIISFLIFSVFLSACSGNKTFRAQTSQSYKISTGDIILIKLQNYPELSEKVVVDFSGTFDSDLLGKVPAKDLTLHDLDVLITGKYSEQLIHPVVDLEILSSIQKTVYVTGKIRRPGIVHYKKELTVEQSIFMAGGMKPTAGDFFAYVLRKKSDGRWTKFKIDLLKKGRNPKKSMSSFKLAPFDIVYITQSTEVDAGDLTYGRGYGTEI